MIGTICTNSKKGSKWISKLLGRRSENEALDSNHDHKQDRSRASLDGGIPVPPSPPSVKFLLGKQKLPHKHRSQPTINLKEELQRKVNWGRDAYDDDDDVKSGHIKPATTLTTDSPRRRKKLAEQRKLTPFPALMDVQVPKSDLQNKRLTSSPPTSRGSAEVHNSASKQPPPPHRPLLQRQVPIYQDEAVDSDDSFTSSEEESEDGEESSEESTDEEEVDFNDRPIMAKNIGIHGAKIAKQVMQRMKNQRYPSIFRKRVINLETLYENQFEIIYETVSCKQVMHHWKILCIFIRSHLKREHNFITK